MAALFTFLAFLPVVVGQGSSDGRRVSLVVCILLAGECQIGGVDEAGQATQGGVTLYLLMVGTVNAAFVVVDHQGHDEPMDIDETDVSMLDLSQSTDTPLESNDMDTEEDP